MRIETISYLKQNAANLDLEEPIIITQSGKPVYRIESEYQAQKRDEAIALLKMMNLAERDIRSGKIKVGKKRTTLRKCGRKKGIKRNKKKRPSSSVVSANIF